jgi:glycosyltransferase involved in cell wall biosynthesis
MHVITGLGIGGAETTLSKLLSLMDRKRYQSVVFSMTGPGPVAETIRKDGVEVHSLGMKRGVPDIRALTRLMGEIRKWRPTVVQTWMYHADLLGGIAGRLCGRVPVVWNIRHSELRQGSDRKMTIRVAQLCARLSLRLPARIVCCAETSRIIHTRMGYLDTRMIVIPNGFDPELYRPEPEAKRLCAEKFGIPAETEVISLIARYHPLKDHQTFLEAAGLFAAEYPGVRFVMCGDGVDTRNQELMSLIDQLQIGKNTILLGRRAQEEIALIMSRSILTTSTSRSEAFPNVVGEAMACGTVCVVTDVGDSAYIVGDCGIVVQPGSASELAAGWRKVMSMDAGRRKMKGLAARRRVEEHFTLPAIVKRYEDLYLELAGQGACA